MKRTMKRISSLLLVLAMASAMFLLPGCGGNSGGQASVTIIRALSLGEIQPGDVVRVMWKEVRVGLVCGVSLSAVCFLKTMLVDRLLLGASDITLAVALVISLTLLVEVVFAKVVGCTFPILAKKLGFDPAVMSSPFITTIVDALSLLIYFQFANLLLGL